MKLRYLASLLALAAATACNDQVAPKASKVSPGPPSAQAAGLPQQAVAPPSELVLTPDGWYHRSCVDTVPNRASIDPGTGLVTRADGTTYHVQKCLYPGRRTRDGRLAPAVFGTSWVEFAQDSTSVAAGNQYGEMTANWTVPQDPDSSYHQSLQQLYGAWPGLVSWGSGSNKTVIQPVLGWGYPSVGYTGGNHWVMAPWSCNLSYSCTVGPHETVHAGDQLYGKVQLVAGSCSNGQCNWNILVQDVTIDSTKSATFEHLPADFRIAEGGAVESAYLVWCKQYPSTGVFFTNITLWDANHQHVTPNWVDRVNDKVDPQCGFNATSTSSTVSLYHNPPPPPPPSVQVTGPQYGNPYSYVTVYATASGGTPPYTYSWKVNGSPYCGGGTSCSTTLGAGGTTTWFTATVTDALSQQGSASLGVYACPPGRSPCQAPATKNGGAP